MKTAIPLALVLLPTLCTAGLNPTSAGLETDFSSKYTWRGMAYSTGPVAQPYGWVTAGRFTVSLWGNAVLDNEKTANGGIFNGGDITGGWSHDFGRLRIEPGFEFWFDRPVAGAFDPATGELSARLSCRVGPVRIFTAQSFDTVRFIGAYYGEAGPNFSVSRKGIDIDANLRQAWASARFNRVYTGVDKTALTFAGLDGSLTHRFHQRLYLRLHSELTWMEDNAIRRQLRQHALFAAGLAFGYEWGK